MFGKKNKDNKKSQYYLAYKMLSVFVIIGGIAAGSEDPRYYLLILLAPIFWFGAELIAKSYVRNVPNEKKKEALKMVKRDLWKMRSGDINVALKTAGFFIGMGVSGTVSGTAGIPDRVWDEQGNVYRVIEALPDDWILLENSIAVRKTTEGHYIDEEGNYYHV